jgi:anti-anti-sigma factor
VSLTRLPDDDGVRVLRAEGDLDAVTAPRLLPAVPALVTGARAVVLDLSRVPFFDSSGVRLLDRLVRACSAQGAPLRVVSPAGTPPRRVLEIVGLAPALAVDDLPSAVAALRGRAG